jgi:hypothetical protein
MAIQMKKSPQDKRTRRLRMDLRNLWSTDPREYLG